MPNSRRISKRQFKVIELLWEGYTRDQIAHELQIAKGTVNRHISNIMEITKTKTAISMCIKIFKKKYKIP